jgi:hypothetical protein
VLQRVSEWQMANKRMTSSYTPPSRLHASRFRAKPPLGTLHASSLILPLLLLTTLHTLYDYFGRWATDPEARYIYGADMAEAARYVNATRAEGLVAISAEYYRDLDPFRLTLHSRGEPPFIIWFDGRQTLAFPPAESGLSPRYIFPASAPPADVWQPFLQPSAAESGREYTMYRLAEPISLHQAQAATFSTDNILKVNVNNNLILSAYQVLGAVVSGGKFQVLLGWQALRTLPPGTDYTFLVQLQDSQNHVWAEADGNGYPPSDWQPGVQGLQLLVLRLPGDLPPQTYHLTVQVIDRRSGQALPTTTGDVVIPLGSLSGQLAQTPRLIDPAKLPNPTQVIPATGPGRDITLRGYEVKNLTARPSEALALTLHWQVLQQPEQNYRLGFFLVNEADTSGEVVYHWPALEPINGEWPTSQWPANYWVQDRVSLPLGADAPFGQFKLRVAWVTEDTQPSWPVNPEGTFTSFDLGPIVVAK